MAKLIANIGIGSQVVQNDFDAMPIFKDMVRVTDDYGNVFVRIPKFYIKKESIAGKYTAQISKEKLPGYYLPQVFWDFTDNKELPYFDYGAYKASLSADGTKLESKAGVKPLVSRNIIQFRDLAKANGIGYQQNDIHAIDVIQTLFRIEFATLNSQAIHPGYTAGNTESNTTGSTDSVVASSGAMGTDGTFSFKYRGIEDVWGNVYEWIDGININDYQAWVCKNAEQYASNVFASPYEKLSYVNGGEDGYVKEMGFDPARPYAEFPVTVGAGANSNTYYADYYYRNTGQMVARLGGSWSTGVSAGLSVWSLIASSSSVGSTGGGRLLRKPL